MRSPYHGYDALSEFDHWDAQTQAAIRDRLEHVPPITFFTANQAQLLVQVAERIMPQHDRPPTQRVPIAPFIDQMLARDDTDGFREPDMPWHQELWRRGLDGIAETSQALYGRGFADLGDDERDRVLRAVQHGEPPGPTWTTLPARKFFNQLVEHVVAVYYAHPAAWSEIGWGGPASPRGYVRTGYGMRDPWEAAERRPASSTAILRRYAQDQETLGQAGEASH